MKKGCLIAIGGSIAITLLGSVYGVYRLVTLYWDNGSASGELPEAATAYRATGLPWVAADIAPPHLPNSKNAAPAIRAAIKLLPAKKFETKLIAELRNPGAQADELVERYAKPLATVGAVMDRSGADFARDWELGPYTTFPEYVPMKVIARAATLRAVRSAMKGNDESAIRDLSLTRRLAQWAGSEPTLISNFVQISLERISFGGAERCLATAKGKLSSIERYAVWLKAANPSPNYRQGLRGEAWLSVSTARNLDYFGGIKAVRNETGQVADSKRLRHDGFPESTKQRAFMTRILQAWVETSQETDGLQKPVLEIGKSIDAIEERWYRKKGFSRTLLMTVYPFFAKTSRAFVAFDARKNVSLAFAEALASEAKTGHWPESVSQIDPFTGQPLRIKRTNNGFRVYSVGQDGKDDGGKHRREVPKGNTASSFDEVAAYPPVTR